VKKVFFLICLMLIAATGFGQRIQLNSGITNELFSVYFSHPMLIQKMFLSLSINHIITLKYGL